MVGTQNGIGLPLPILARVNPTHGGSPMSKPMLPTPQFVEGPQGQLYLDDGGSGGTPVVLVHSAAGSTTHWEAQLSHLRRTRRAMALDVRGHGHSEPPRDGSYAVADMGADVVASADALGLNRFILVGHSQGGAVAIAAAAQASVWAPGRVAGLVLLDPATDGRLMPKGEAAGLLAALRSPAYAQIMEGYWKSLLSGSRPEVVEQLLADLHATRTAAIIGGLEALFSFDPLTPLRAFTFPCLSVITPITDRPDALHRLLPDLPTERVENTGHWLQLDAPERVNAILDRFLVRVP